MGARAVKAMWGSIKLMSIIIVLTKRRRVQAQPCRDPHSARRYHACRTGRASGPRYPLAPPHSASRLTHSTCGLRCPHGVACIVRAASITSVVRVLVCARQAPDSPSPTDNAKGVRQILTGSNHRRRVKAMVSAGAAVSIASIAGPIIALLATGEATRRRWSLIGQAMTPISIFLSALAVIAIVFAFAMQPSTRSEIALRALHVDLIKMALDDQELAEVWPPLGPDVPETRKDHYCNLILNLQKVAYKASTIDESELRGALAHLMRSPDMHAFWTKARNTRVDITGGDPDEEEFTALVDAAYRSVQPPPS